MRNASFSETQLLDTAAADLRRRVPPSWQLDCLREPTRSRSSRDALLIIRAPDDTKAKIAVEVKQRIDPKDVPGVVNQLRRSPGADAWMVVAPFIGPRTQERLIEAGVGYADVTGNLHLGLTRPVLGMHIMGASANPSAEPRPLRSLKGPAAGRVVRALCDFRPPYGVRQLAMRSATSAAAVSRVATLLDREALVTRGERGMMTAVDWPGLLRRWVEDYALPRSNYVQTFLGPRGLPALLDELRAASWRYAVTGSLAETAAWPVAPARLAVVYVDAPREAAESLGLRPATAGANVWLVEPFDPVVFERTWTREGITYAARTQVVADLLTSPGRGPAEGEELIRWMQDNEDVWRS